MSWANHLDQESMMMLMEKSWLNLKQEKQYVGTEAKENTIY